MREERECVSCCDRPAHGDEPLCIECGMEWGDQLTARDRAMHAADMANDARKDGR